jgi:uncharacterized secreted protein with C-terminal beta-propeller domain
MKAKLLCLIFCFSILQCFEENENPQMGKSIANLKLIDGCDSLLKSLKQSAVNQMEEQVNKNLENALKWGYCNYWGYQEDGDLLAGASPSSTNSSKSEHATSYSTTNNQVASVDEADFIKNDGAYIYIIADSKFQIIDAWPAEQAVKISSSAIEGTPEKLFVLNDTALVYSSLKKSSENAKTGGYYYNSGECTYGYDCDFTGNGLPMKITVFDIKDRTNPVIVRETYFSGSYINSRRIGSAVFTVVNFPEVSFPGISYCPEKLYELYSLQNTPYKELLVIMAFDELKKKNIKIIEDTKITDWIPSVKDIRYADGVPLTEENLLNGCINFYESEQKDGKTLLSLVSFDMEKLDPINTTTIVGRPGAVYASEDSLYVSSRHYYSYGMPWYYDDTETFKEASTVHKFALKSGNATAVYKTSGVVKGKVLNQFSMDESKGFFRIATTTGHVPDPKVHSTISVITEQDGELKIVGQIDNIAPTEDIRSVRFDGDRGFIVTFKKTDPLFVIDFRNPHNPLIAGELKIPGFSTYMQMMDENHLISIGYDADDQGSFAWFQGIQLQIFDITDIKNPFLDFKEVIGTRGSTSDAATNHFAFNYFAPKNLLAIPMTVCEGGSGGNYGDLMTFSGLLVYKVTVNEGFKLLGGVSHETPETPETYTNACGNWWTHSNSKVKRSIFMDDFVYSVALDLIKVANLGYLKESISEILLTEKK